MTTKKFIRKEILFLSKDIALIERASKKHHLKFGPFVKAAVMAYLKGLYIVPDPDQLKQLEQAIKRWGVNINQVAFQANRTQSVHQYHLIELTKRVTQLEQFVRDILTRPDNLNDLVRQALQQHPNYRQVLEQILAQTV